MSRSLDRHPLDRQPNVWSLYRRAAERFEAPLPLMTSTPQRPTFSRTSPRISPHLPHDLLSSTAPQPQKENIQNDALSQDLVSKWSKKYAYVKKENEELKRAIRDKDHVIRQLTDAVRALQSEIDTSESQREKSTSTTSSSGKQKTPPVGRVTPTKRTSATKSPRRSPRSPRGGASRQSAVRHLFGHRRLAGGGGNVYSNQSTSTPERLTRARQILRESGIGSDVLASSHSSSTPSHPQDRRQADRRVESEPRHERRPVLIERNGTREEEESDTTVASDDTFVLEMSPRREVQSETTTPVHRRGAGADRSTIRNQTYIIESLSSSSPAQHPDWQTAKSPGYYLRMMRPEFIRRVEERQAYIRAASEGRENIEKMRREAARKLVKGEITIDDAREILYQDPTRIRAFPESEMRALTKKNLAATTEYRQQRRENQRVLDRAANQIISYFYSQNTKNVRRLSMSQPVLY